MKIFIGLTTDFIRTNWRVGLVFFFPHLFWIDDLTIFFAENCHSIERSKIQDITEGLNVYMWDKARCLSIHLCVQRWKYTSIYVYPFIYGPWICYTCQSSKPIPSDSTHISLSSSFFLHFSSPHRFFFFFFI